MGAWIDEARAAEGGDGHGLTVQDDLEPGGPWRLDLDGDSPDPLLQLPDSVSGGLTIGND